MIKVTILLLVVFIILLCVNYIVDYNYVNIESSSKRYYKVNKNQENQLQAANSLDSLYQIAIKLDKLMKGNIINETYERYSYRLKGVKIMEMPVNDKSEGFIVDKGKVIKIKIRNSGSFIDENYVKYVFLHELAHMMSKSYGHNEEFNENFKIILKIASENGIYIPSTSNINFICGGSNCLNNLQKN